MFFANLSLELSDTDVMSALELVFRWVHVVAAILWLGVAYYQSWIFTPFAKELAPETAHALGARLLPRAMFFYRFGSLYTFAFGQILLFNLYYMSGDYFFRPLTEFAGTRPQIEQWIQPFLILFLGVGVYELLLIAFGKRAPLLAVIGWAIAVTLFAYYLIEVLEVSHRCAFVHVAALLGTTMVANTWSHIWPAMHRVSQAHQRGEAAAPEDLARASERGRHNILMSMPVVLLMLGVHLSWLTGLEHWYLTLAAIFLISGAATHALFKKARQLDEEQWTI